MRVELHNPLIVCRKCGQDIIIPDVPTITPEKGQSRTSWLAAQWDELTPLLHKRGWVVVRNELGGREALCQPCSLKSAPAASALPEFSIRPKCVICGHGKATVKYCDGRTRACAAGHRDHVHRTCERCGYQWVELPRTANERTDINDHRNPPPPGDSEPDHGIAGGSEVSEAIASTG